MDKTWVLVACASSAVLYDYVSRDSNTHKPALHVVEEFNHPDSRKKNTELVSDREGQYRSGSGHGNFVETSDPHQFEAKAFAIELCKKLEQSRGANQFKSLVLVAEPHFMGLLRQCIENWPQQNVSIREILKDYTKEPVNKLLGLLNL
jgi:protein required for attachment to host cells